MADNARGEQATQANMAGTGIGRACDNGQSKQQAQQDGHTGDRFKTWQHVSDSRSRHGAPQADA